VGREFILPQAQIRENSDYNKEILLKETMVVM
jgi:hypothetical protein